MPAGDDNQRRPPFLSEKQKRWALINFDRFVKPYEPKLDLSTHTNIGVILSVLLVPAIIAYAIYQAVYIYEHPYDSAIATGVTIGEAEMIDITCRAPWGCYVAMKYNSQGVSKLCYDTAVQSGFSGQKGWKPPPDSAPQLCTSMVYGEIIRNVTLCYSPDPYDGIYIAWNKNPSLNSVITTTAGGGSPSRKGPGGGGIKLKEDAYEADYRHVPIYGASVYSYHFELKESKVHPIELKNNGTVVDEELPIAYGNTLMSLTTSTIVQQDEAHTVANSSVNGWYPTFLSGDGIMNEDSSQVFLDQCSGLFLSDTDVHASLCPKTIGVNPIYTTNSCTPEAKLANAKSMLSHTSAATFSDADTSNVLITYEGDFRHALIRLSPSKTVLQFIHKSYLPVVGATGGFYTALLGIFSIVVLLWQRVACLRRRTEGNGVGNKVGTEEDKYSSSSSSDA